MLKENYVEMVNREKKISPQQKQWISDIEYILSVKFNGKTYGDALEFIATYKEIARKKKEERKSTATYAFKPRRGSEMPNALLNEDKVMEIKYKFREGYTNLQLAQEYGVSATTISEIRCSRRWTHVRIENSLLTAQK